MRPMTVRGVRRGWPLALVPVVACLGCASLAAQTEEKNYLNGGKDEVGLFTKTSGTAYPWDGVDASGQLRRAVSLPGANPFVTKSNQFTYAWLGHSATFADLDGDGLKDLMAPDGAGLFWFWKNTGSAGKPQFGRGEVMPLLVDDQRSKFIPVVTPPKQPNSERKLTPSQEAEKRRVDEKREKQFERLKKKNEREDEDKQVDDAELRRQVAEMLPYEWETEAAKEAEAQKNAQASAAVPPGGLANELNTFRRLRPVATVVDWNGDQLPDVVVGDSGGTVYFARNTGKPGLPNFGLTTRSAHYVPLKVAKVPSKRGGLPVYEPVNFMNYAMPFACDWDGNGIPDLLVGEGTYSVNTIRLFKDAARAANLSPPVETPLYVGNERTFLAPFAHDWNGDGKLDLFVADAEGRLTVHLQPGDGGALEPPQDLKLDGGNKPLAYCPPQPCDWNEDGAMDLVWGEPYGRIMVALGKGQGVPEFAAPFAVRSTHKPATLQFPENIALVAAAALVTGDLKSGGTHGGSGSAERYYRADGSFRADVGGWAGDKNDKFWGLMPAWNDNSLPTVEKVLDEDKPGGLRGKVASWAIAPLPGDYWESVEESGAPGQGRTLLLRWHDWSTNSVFKFRPTPDPRWTRGVSIRFPNGRPGPYGGAFTKGSIRIRFHMKLDGKFSRMHVYMRTSWGPLRNGKPPEEGGSFEAPPMLPPPTGKWFEFSHTEPPGKEHQRGLEGTLFIYLLGDGEVRIRDVRITEGP